MRLQLDHVAVAVNSAFEKCRAGGRPLAKVAVAGQGVEEMVIDGRHQDSRQFVLQGFQLGEQFFAALAQPERPGYRISNGPDVRDDFTPMGENA